TGVSSLAGWLALLRETGGHILFRGSHERSGNRARRDGDRRAPERDVSRRSGERPQVARDDGGEDAAVSNPHSRWGSRDGGGLAVRSFAWTHHVPSQVISDRARRAR